MAKDETGGLTVEEYLTRVCEEQVARLVAESEAQVAAFQADARTLRAKFEALPDEPDENTNGAPNAAPRSPAHGRK